MTPLIPLRLCVRSLDMARGGRLVLAASDDAVCLDASEYDTARADSPFAIYVTVGNGLSGLST